MKGGREVHPFAAKDKFVEGKYLPDGSNQSKHILVNEKHPGSSPYVDAIESAVAKLVTPFVSDMVHTKMNELNNNIISEGVVLAVGGGALHTLLTATREGQRFKDQYTAPPVDDFNDFITPKDLDFRVYVPNGLSCKTPEDCDQKNVVKKVKSTLQQIKTALLNSVKSLWSAEFQDKLNNAANDALHNMDTSLPAEVRFETKLWQAGSITIVPVDRTTNELIITKTKNAPYTVTDAITKTPIGDSYNHSIEFQTPFGNSDSITSFNLFRISLVLRVFDPRFKDSPTKDSFIVNVHLVDVSLPRNENTLKPNNTNWKQLHNMPPIVNASYMLNDYINLYKFYSTQQSGNDKVVRIKNRIQVLKDFFYFVYDASTPGGLRGGRDFGTMPFDVEKLTTFSGVGRKTTTVSRKTSIEETIVNNIVNNIVWFKDGDDKLKDDAKVEFLKVFKGTLFGGRRRVRTKKASPNKK